MLSDNQFVPRNIESSGHCPKITVKHKLIAQMVHNRMSSVQIPIHNPLETVMRSARAPIIIVIIAVYRGNLVLFEECCGGPSACFVESDLEYQEREWRVGRQ